MRRRLRAIFGRGGKSKGIPSVKPSQQPMPNNNVAHTSPTNGNDNASNPPAVGNSESINHHSHGDESTRPGPSRPITAANDSRQNTAIAKRNGEAYGSHERSSSPSAHAQNTPLNTNLPSKKPLGAINQFEERTLISPETGLRSPPLPSPDATRDHSGAPRARSSSNSSGIFDEELRDSGYSLEKAVEGVVDLRNTTDIDQTTSYAPTVTHETVYPQQHEITEEHIYREIHNHDVYHRIQPVYDIQVLPTRHFMLDSDGGFIEVSQDDLPTCTGANERWYIGERPLDASPSEQRDPPELAFAKNAGEQKYLTSDGLERTDTTIVHTPTLEDISTVNGPVLPVHFDEYGFGQEMPILERMKDLKLAELTGNIRDLPTPIPDKLVPDRKASIRRKPVST
ncbi:hypothetical protein BJ170DRAFT_646460 [Xylariales sp. AK1849]|nr:hypothetical protein BJ170DRAFT_646460 [Xylariales sp. AK1849]